MKNLISIIAITSLISSAGLPDQITSKNCQTNKTRNEQILIRDLLPQQLHYDIKSYAIDVEIDPNEHTVNGSVIIEFTSTYEEITEIIFDAADHLTIENIESDGLINFTHSNDLLHLYYETSLPIGEIQTANISYHGDTGLGITFTGGITYSAGYFYSYDTPYGLYKWVPCKDHPSDKADWLDLKLRAPDQYVVAANGVLQDIINHGDGTKTHHWHESYPITTYLFAINAYPYNVFTEYFQYNEQDSMIIEYYVPNNVYDGFRFVETALPAFSNIFGLYPFVDEKFAIAKVPGNIGAMEHQNCVTTSTTNGMVQVHELAHQWFGDMVTCTTWHHGWLNEGFATYSEALFVESTQSYIAYLDYMDSIEFQWNDNLSVFVTDTSNFNQIFDIIIYNKGAWVNHMLRKVVGSETYFEALQDYLDIYAFDNAVTDELKAVFETHYGEDLQWFFDQWVYGNGHPQYEFQWASTTNNFFLVVNQTASGSAPDIFTMPMDIQLNFENGESLIETYWLTEENQSFEMEIPTTVSSINVDPENWVLEESTISGTTEFSLGEADVTILDDSEDGIVNPGELFQMTIQLTNLGIPFGTVTGTLSTNNQDVIIHSDTVNFNSAGLGEISLSAEPFELQLSEDYISQIAEFTIQLTWEGYTDTVQFNIALGTPEILVVNATGNTLLSQFYQQFAMEAGIVTQLWDAENLISLETLMPQFNNVFYFSGDNVYEPVPSLSQDLLTDHVNSGGNLLIMGQAIGNTLANTNFYNDVLKAQYIGEHNGYLVYGNNEHDIIQGADIFADNSPDCDVMIPINGAVSAFEYSGGNGTAGLISDFPGKLLFIGFDLSHFIESNSFGMSKSEFLNMTANWFRETGLMGDVNQDGILDVLDIIITVNFVMGNETPTDLEFQRVDMNNDLLVDVLDIVLMVTIIMGN